MRAVIAGGGVAGAAVACLLGPDALLIEREAAAHDKICGEFISWEAQAYLAQLGLDLPALGPATIHSVRLVHGARCAEARLPFAGLGLSRQALDEAMLARAGRAGATLLRGHAVRAVHAEAVEVDGQGHIPARSVFLATGKHDLRGTRRMLPKPPEDLVGLKMYFRLDPRQQAALDGHVEVVLFQGGYAGLQMVEGGRANLCLLMERAQFKAAGRSWPGVQDQLMRECPHLAARLAGALPLLPQPLTIFRVPYGFVHQPGLVDPPGLFRLGDQMGVIPSFCGDGVSIALHSAFVAVAAHHGEGATAYHQLMRRHLARQIGRASAFYSLGRTAPRLVVETARIWPGALRWMARLTRVPPAALRDTASAT